MTSHEFNDSSSSDSLFVQLETEMGQLDNETRLAFEALDYAASIKRQQSILDMVREVHQRELSEAGVLYRALERLPGADAGQNIEFQPVLTAGTGEVYFLATRDDQAATQRVSVGRIEKRPNELDRYAPNKGFELSDVRLMASQFRQLEDLKAEGILPNLETTGTFGIRDPRMSIMRKG